MSNPIQEAVLKAMEADPSASNDQIAEFVRQVVPGAKTTAASVSSMKSRLKSSIGSGAGLSSGLSDLASSLTFDSLPDQNEDDPETAEEAAERINLRYKAMERMTARIVRQGMPSLIVSGPPGLGKSYTAEGAIEELEAKGELHNVLGEEPADEVDLDADWTPEQDDRRMFDVISGSITAVGLFQALWATRNGGVLLLDDIDEVFRDEVCLNLLKAALDGGKKRMLSWRKEANWLRDYGIDKTFEFKGHVIFLTNIDFEAEIAKEGKMAEHFKALIDRSMYLCLTLRTKRDFMIRIRQVAEGEDGMLCNKHGLTVEETEEVLEFVEDNKSQFYNLSLRLVDQVAQMRAIDPEGWQDDVRATKMRSY